MVEDELDKAEEASRQIAAKHGLDTAKPGWEFLAGKKEWEDNHGSLKVRNRNLGIYLVASLIANSVLAFGLIHLSTQSRVIPYVAIIDRAGGKVVGLGAAEQTASSIMEQVKQQQLEDWIVATRSVVSEWALQRQYIAKSMVYVPDTSPAYGRLKDWYTENRPDIRSKEGTVTVTVTDKLAVPRTNTYEVEWTETSWNTSGHQTGRTFWKGTFTVEVRPPKTIDAAEKNTLGLYIPDFNWSQKQ